jgi:hypothetical protein
MAGRYAGIDEVERLAQLQKKLNRYFDFIESGEVFKAFAKSTGRAVAKSPVRISIVARERLGDEGRCFLAHVGEAAKAARVGLTFKVQT